MSECVSECDIAGAVDTVFALVTAKADVDAYASIFQPPGLCSFFVVRKECTPLQLALERNGGSRKHLRHALVSALVRFKADVNKAAQGTEPPLHLALNLRDSLRADTVRLLISAKADVNAQGMCLSFQRTRQVNVDDTRLRAPLCTPLHCAARRSDACVVKCLLKAKADPAARDSYGRTPLSYVDKLRRPGVFWALSVRT